jgi:3-methylcrotonyl-CoA carboxylase alpha subunit
VLKSLLVANRGEIACRIFRSARRLGVRTVAVFSDADASARHTLAADEALRIGPASARESYLDAARIIAAARAAGAEAVHPGYGFLAENAAFAQACVDAGLVFVGPPASAIAAMGSKILAKTRMAAAGVPVLPGYAGEEQELAALAREARRVGLPLIVKPAAGGGGKGMQIVREERELQGALAAARRLAESAFGDGALLIERYLAAPRHVEVQVFADTFGNYVHLADRDCSIQRRHQKLIEEAPAPAIPDAVRERLRQAALTVAREIGYVGAGTVEFLFDAGAFYFMEMNTRLQVEHTVTEAVTGLDLVEWQLRVASGEALPLTQEEITVRGHAIEARVVAEDPAHGFLPSAGRLELLEWPQGPGVRVDAGFGTGDVVPEHYDSLLGKVIAAASTREEAAARLAQALAATLSAGVHTNEQYLARILSSPSFLEVRHNIALLDTAGAQFAASPPLPAEAVILAGLAVHARQQSSGTADPWACADAFTPNLPARVPYTFAAAGGALQLELAFAGGAVVSATLDGKEARAVRAVCADGETISAQIGERRLKARVHFAGERVYLWLEGLKHELTLEDPRTREFTASAATGGLATPLPGAVVSVPVKVGEAVNAGDVLMVIEAMKMEHTITAPYAGTVTAIHFAPGERVPEASELLALARAEG